VTTAIKSVSVGLEMLEMAERNKISLSHAVKVGISVLLADAGEEKYINQLNVYRKMAFLSEKLKETTRKIEEYEQKTGFCLLENR